MFGMFVSYYYDFHFVIQLKTGLTAMKRPAFMCRKL